MCSSSSGSITYTRTAASRQINSQSNRCLIMTTLRQIVQHCFRRPEAGFHFALSTENADVTGGWILLQQQAHEGLYRMECDSCQINALGCECKRKRKRQIAIETQELSETAYVTREDPSTNAA